MTATSTTAIGDDGYPRDQQTTPAGSTSISSPPSTASTSTAAPAIWSPTRIPRPPPLPLRRQQNRRPRQLQNPRRQPLHRNHPITSARPSIPRRCAPKSTPTASAIPGGFPTMKPPAGSSSPTSARTNMRKSTSSPRAATTAGATRKPSTPARASPRQPRPAPNSPIPSTNIGHTRQGNNSHSIPAVLSIAAPACPNSSATTFLPITAAGTSGPCTTTVANGTPPSSCPPTSASPSPSPRPAQWRHPLLLDRPAPARTGLAPQSNGQIKRLVRTGVQGPPPPAKLSLVGAFKDLQTLEPADGLIPYEPNVTFWSDYAIKDRWFMLPNAADKISFNAHRQLDLPHRHGLGETLRHGTDPRRPRHPPPPRNPLPRQNRHSVYGITYKWRPDNSDADLVPEAGVDEVLNINDHGIKKQTWHYPSQSECMTCHTQVGGLALGFNTWQLNGNGAGSENQIAMLARAGYFSADSASPTSTPSGPTPRPATPPPPSNGASVPTSAPTASNAISPAASPRASGTPGPPCPWLPPASSTAPSPTTAATPPHASSPRR